ncbi:hypothetical protein GGR52DRAFT_576020 [Hypoxylon sp. FL1284]|nr:hypothetical protein GGR52DRAFT_576020 [Hypoxylon sp. FL1284]
MGSSKLTKSLSSRSAEITSHLLEKIGLKSAPPPPPPAPVVDEAAKTAKACARMSDVVAHCMQDVVTALARDPGTAAVARATADEIIRCIINFSKDVDTQACHTSLGHDRLTHLPVLVGLDVLRNKIDWLAQYYTCDPEQMALRIIRQSGVPLDAWLGSPIHTALQVACKRIMVNITFIVLRRSQKLRHAGDIRKLSSAVAIAACEAATEAAAASGPLEDRPPLSHDADYYSPIYLESL